jgi:tetratricopeptide (TPR) repeat protein
MVNAVKAIGPWPLAILILIGGCRWERPDPVASTLAILHKHPSDFIAQLTALDALGTKEADLPTFNWMDNLYQLSARLKPLIAKAQSDSEKVLLLQIWVFDSLQLVSVIDSNDLATSLPSQVLSSRKGSCLGLSLVFLALGQILELPIYPVFLPSHIFVRYRNQNFVTNIETLRKGIARTDEFYWDTFALAKRPWYKLKDAEPKQALAALIFNMANLHRQQGQWKYALAEYKLAEESLPGYPEALGNQGAGYLIAGDRKQAETLLLAAWSGDSLAESARLNLSHIYRNAGDSAKTRLFTER